MSGSPHWARGENPGAEETAVSKMHQDIRATKLHLGTVGRLPVDQEAARRELSEEQRHNRGTRPRTRKWRALDRLDSEIDALRQRQAETMARLTDAEQAFTDAPRADAQTLADWISGGERGERPAASLPERERELAAAQLLGEAVVVEIDRALERRLQFIEKNREKMLGDARKDIDQAREALSQKVAELAPLRETLVDARSNLTWVAAYPDPVTQFRFPDAVALGLREPVERTLSTRAQIAYVSLIAALEEDMAALASAFSDEQKRQLGHPDEATPISTAMWNDDPRAAAWRKQELERARAIGEYSPNLNQVRGKRLPPVSTHLSPPGRSVLRRRGGAFVGPRPVDYRGG